MVPFEDDTEVKHGLKQVGKKFVFSINGVDPEDAGLYQVEVDGVKVFSTDFKRKMMHHSVMQMLQCHMCQTPYNSRKSTKIQNKSYKSIILCFS